MPTIIKAYKYPLRVTQLEAKTLFEMSETHRRVYNNALRERKDQYAQDKTMPTFREQRDKLPQLRKVNQYVANVNQNSLQETLRRLDNAYKAFYRRLREGTPVREAGEPRFCAYGEFKTIVFASEGNGIKRASRTRLYIQNVGKVRMRFYRDFPEGARVKTVLLTREINKWSVIFTLEFEIPEPIPVNDKVVGIDLGLKSFLVTSEGDAVDAPKHLRKTLRELRILQRRMDRRKVKQEKVLSDGRVVKVWSKGREKARVQVAQKHSQIARQRKEFHIAVARWLTLNYGVVAHENLNIKGLAKSRLAFSVLDAGWGGMLLRIEQMSRENGCRVVAVPAAGTTQECSRCGGRPEVPITLSQRTYKCEHCGLIMDRDENAAINVMKRGIHALESPETLLVKKVRTQLSRVKKEAAIAVVA